MLSFRNRRRPPVRLLSAIPALWWALSVVAVALPAAAASDAAEVLVILASTEDGPVEAELRKIEALQKPPFSTFKSMKVLSKSSLAAGVGQPEQVALPNGRHVQVELLEQRPDGRFKVRVAINKPDTKDYLPGLVVIASPGEPFFVAGQKHAGGTLVIGVRMGQKAGDKP